MPATRPMDGEPLDYAELWLLDSLRVIRPSFVAYQTSVDMTAALAQLEELRRQRRDGDDHAPARAGGGPGAGGQSGHPPDDCREPAVPSRPGRHRAVRSRGDVRRTRARHRRAPTRRVWPSWRRRRPGGFRKCAEADRLEAAGIESDGGGWCPLESCGGLLCGSCSGRLGSSAGQPARSRSRRCRSSRRPLRVFVASGVLVGGQVVPRVVPVGGQPVGPADDDHHPLGRSRCLGRTGRRAGFWRRSRPSWSTRNPRFMRPRNLLRRRESTRALPDSYQ